MTHRPEMDWVQASWYRKLNLYKNPLSAICKVTALRYPCELSWKVVSVESFIEGVFCEKVSSRLLQQTLECWLAMPLTSQQETDNYL